MYDILKQRETHLSRQAQPDGKKFFANTKKLHSPIGHLAVFF